VVNKVTRMPSRGTFVLTFVENFVEPGRLGGFSPCLKGAAVLALLKGFRTGAGDYSFVTRSERNRYTIHTQTRLSNDCVSIV
jgi:hypothetical protein